MRMSHQFGQTLRTAPGEVEAASHQLLLRAGYIRQLAAGIFSYLPLGLRVIRKIEAIIREEMDRIGGQEVVMPVVHPAEIWQETGRWYQIGAEMVRFKDRGERDMVLAMTHEEIVADLTRQEIQSYRQLPALIYQIQTKFRDEPRSRAGLIRVREFTMKDSYSLDLDTAGLEQQYSRHYTAYYRIFSRAGLTNVVAVKSDVGMMGGKVAHEYMFLSAIGEDTLVLCGACGYSANQQVARFSKPEPVREELLTVETVETPDARTIAELAEFLQIPASRTAKVVFFTAGIPDAAAQLDAVREVLVMAIVRGDMEVNETKLGNAVSARWMKPATVEAIRAVGAEPGYASPVGISREGVRVVVDDLVAESSNLVAGANLAGYHLRNVNVGRDYKADLVADITAAGAGTRCPECGEPLRLERGVEVGNIFQLGTRYTEALGATYLNAEGQACPVVMGSYGIGVGRLVACVAEAHHDEQGLKLPLAVAPFAVHLVSLAAQDAALVEKADALYSELSAAGIEVLYDDRPASAGVKFADADLLGIPLRVTLSARSLKNGGLELKERSTGQLRIIPESETVSTLRAEIARLKADEESRIVEVKYSGN